MSVVSLRVNGATHEVDVEPSTPLLYVLRNDLDLRGPRFGCGLAQCGACTVLVDGAAVRSCVVPAAQVSGEITTLEGLAKDGKLDPLQQAWIDEQVPQCGYCQNGQIMTAKALLDRNPNPTDAEIREGMEGVLCQVRNDNTLPDRRGHRPACEHRAEKLKDCGDQDRLLDRQRF
jgi:aerobic-type carbon monoxide dehydrogenase small subunit (CoxS/CutS family)